MGHARAGVVMRVLMILNGLLKTATPNLPIKLKNTVVDVSKLKLVPGKEYLLTFPIQTAEIGIHPWDPEPPSGGGGSSSTPSGQPRGSTFKCPHCGKKITASAT